MGRRCSDAHLLEAVEEELEADIEAGKAKRVIERRYPLSEVAAALQHVGEGHSQGQTIIQIAS